MKTNRSKLTAWLFVAGVGLLVAVGSFQNVGGTARAAAGNQSGAEPHQPQHTNRLIHEKSPYLLQHAHNPVDWYPWGEAAFAKARQENKPIFLSVGYSTCHWCHVMERESFENTRHRQNSE